MEEPKYSYEIAISRLMKQCSMVEKCCSDIYRKMREWGFDGVVAQNAIDQLVEQRFVDERRYCRSYVRDKSKVNGWGEMKIRHMLYSKRVPKDVIDWAMTEFLDATVVSDKCYSLLERKLKSVKYDDKYQLRNKLVAYGAARGYDIELIKKHIAKLIVKID